MSPVARDAAASPKKAAPRRVVTNSETLDGSWDRKLSSGRVVPDLTLDLHGLSRETARALLLRRVDSAARNGARVILVITGKGQTPGAQPADLMPGVKPPKGAIRASLPRWLGEAGISERVAAVRRAHPRHGGAGAVYLILRRAR
ncbi:Smr/MutS family protein [Sandaracinobacteroides saxicola]|nr:Smr/MutS family protein [Sandaracinobacteroides saxicola]